MSIQELINKELAQEQADRATRERSGRYNPSNLGRCYRLQYFSRKNEPVTNPPKERNLRVMKCGSIFHNIIQELVLKNNPNIQKEVLIKTDDFVGYADLVDTDEVIDIKTIHSKGFSYLSPKNIAKEKYSNWMQVLWYAWKLNKKSACLAFLSKDDLRIDEYRQDLDNYWLNELDMEETKLIHYWKEKTFPPATPRAFNGKDCQYCSWLNKCMEIEGENHPTLKKGVTK